MNETRRSCKRHEYNPKLLITTSNQPEVSHKNHNKSSDQRDNSNMQVCRRHSCRISSSIMTNRMLQTSSRRHQRRAFIMSCALVLLALLLVTPMSERRSHNSVEAAKTLKALAKTFVFQRLTQRKHFVPLPVPIPVPIEINEKPVYLKGKPKYVNVYKPKPTSPPATKPTTVYNMPIYSPTYEYMSMDPMSSMYSSPMLYAGQYAPSGSGYKSSMGGETDSSSSATGAAHAGVDYDDDTGNYYVRKGAGRRSKMSSNDYAYDYNLHRNDQNSQQEASVGKQSDADAAASQQHDLAVSGSNTEEDDIEAPIPGDDESYDHESEVPHSRVKRQVYYQSGYDEDQNCEGFPLEINVRSRIKLDRIFPIHGKSQIKKCVKFKKSLLPPVNPEY